MMKSVMTSVIKSATPLVRTGAKVLLSAGSLMLLAACGASTATPPLWQSFTSTDMTHTQVNRLAVTDADGNTWHAFTDVVEGNQLRWLDSNGNEQWRMPLATGSVLLANTRQGAVVVNNDTVMAVNSDGSVDWSRNLMPAGNDIRALAIGSDDRILLGAIASGRQQVNLAAFNPAGVLLWDQSFASSGLVVAIRLAETASGGALLLTQTEQDARLTSRVIDAQGNSGDEHVLASNNYPFYAPRLAVQADHISVFSNDILYLLAADGSLAWQRTAPQTPGLQRGPYRCSTPAADRIACFYSTRNTEAIGASGKVHVEWLDYAGTAVTSKTYSMDTPAEILSDGAERWVLVEKSAPDDTSASLNVLNPNPRHSMRLHVLNSSGVKTQTISMLSSKVYPANCLGFACMEMRFRTDAELYFSGTLTATQLIVTGSFLDVVNDGESSSAHSFVSSYRLP